MAIGLAGELSYSVIPVGWLLDDTVTSQGDTLYVLVGGGVTAASPRFTTGSRSSAGACSARASERSRSC